ncbi:hypothetical protein GGI21_000113 [Coemansia aciculifera]|nr:hypothetical protein GGI21_000113 [Coemansia aciculifera]
MVGNPINYSDFVNDFIAAYARDSRPTAKIARKLCDTWPLPSKASLDTIRVAVMDSSFNPPHYCHGAYIECLGTTNLKAAAAASHSKEPALLGIDAFLLLLGSQNADKPQQGATFEQRMCMTDMLATTIAMPAAEDTSSSWHVWEEDRRRFDASNLHNMAIGMVNVPRFVDKCQAVRNVVLEELPLPNDYHGPLVLCYFCMGWDTLVRFFDKKYYGSDHPAEISRFFANGGRISYARRGDLLDSQVAEFLAAPHLAPYLQFIYELELPDRVKHVSSTGVRQAIYEERNSQDTPPQILEYIDKSKLYQ